LQDTHADTTIKKTKVSLEQTHTQKTTINQGSNRALQSKGKQKKTPSPFLLLCCFPTDALCVFQPKFRNRTPLYSPVKKLVTHLLQIRNEKSKKNIPKEHTPNHSDTPWNFTIETNSHANPIKHQKRILKTDWLTFSKLLKP